MSSIVVLPKYDLDNIDGIINEGFPVGTIFTIDWNNRRMRCEGNAMIY